MKIPLIWLKDYLDTDKSAKDLAASFTQLGLMLDKPLDKTNILDLEHRMDRSDWLSMIGCARDLAAFEGIPLKLPKLSTKPGLKPKDENLIPINVNAPAVRRFQTRIFKGIKVAPSPKWLANRLTAYGMEPINNIVDITNFVMCEYGQPLHAQDIAKLPGRDITIRSAKNDEKLTTLLGTEIKLNSNIPILTSGNIPTVILGVVGGQLTGVTNSTADIILDSGNYDSRVIRKSSRQFKIMNETVSRDDKFLDPRAIDFAMARATDLILELAGGTYYTNDDYYPNPVIPKTQTLRLSRLHLLSGMDLTLTAAKKILKSLEYSVIEEGEGSLTVEIPYFRTDVEVEDDLISDILRIHNYTLIPQISLSTPIPTDITPDSYRFEEHLRDLLVAQGAHEHITNSLVTSVNQSDQIILANALSTDQNALRHNLSDGLSHVISTYKKHKIENVLVFEIGKTFTKQKNKYLEHRLLTVCATCDVRDSLATLLSSLGITKTNIGTIAPSSYTIDTEELMSLAKNYTGIISDFTHTQSRDISLLVPLNLTFADISKMINDLTLTIQSVSCKSFTKFKDKNNYLITVVWPQNSNVDREQALIIKSTSKVSPTDSR